MGIYVVGMHRSGTSAVAGLLSALTGLPAGRLAVPSNPGGQWERPELRPALELFLAANGHSWAHPPAESDRLRLSGPLAAYASRVFRRHGADRFLWKDPRLCLTIDHWLDQPQTEPRVVVVHRRPEEVARSLAARNGWSTERGLALWERTNRNAIVRLGGREVFAVEHGQLLADPAGSTAALAAWLGLGGQQEPVGAGVLARAAATISPPEPPPTGEPTAAEAPLTENQGALAERLGRTTGPTTLDLDGVGPESPSTVATLGQPSRTELARRAGRAVWAIPRRHRLEIAGPGPTIGP